MKLSELSRYWAARELTQMVRRGNSLSFDAPFACPEFTVSIAGHADSDPTLRMGGDRLRLEEVSNPLRLRANTWCRTDDRAICCFDLRKGASTLAGV
jgi:hypothetical protein